MNCKLVSSLLSLVISLSANGASQSQSKIAFTIIDWDCPAPGGSLRPCYSRTNIWTVNSDGTGIRALTRIEAFQCGSYGPVWSPDSTIIAFTSSCAHQDIPAATSSKSANLENNIWVMKPDGSQPRMLTEFREVVGAANPVWSPDGRKIAFMSDAPLNGRREELRGNGANIWIMNRDGSQAKPVTHITADEIGAGSVQTGSIAWSPDGKMIAFLSSRGLDGADQSQNRNEVVNLWVINVKGSGLRPLTKFTRLGTYIGGPVAWSPDSRKVAFSWYRGIDANTPESQWASNIWIANADGSELKLLTRFKEDSAPASYLSWSADGSRLAFGAQGKIWIASPVESVPRPIVDLGGEYELTAPALSRDGKMITFLATAKRISEIWVANTNGSGTKQITQLRSLGLGGPLAWQP